MDPGAHRVPAVRVWEGGRLKAVEGQFQPFVRPLQSLFG